MNVSSIVVQAMSENIDALVEEFKKSELCDYHLHDKDKGKIILTIEGENVGVEIEKLVKIQEMPKVMAADMMMTYQEDQLDSEIKHLNEQDLVPSMLNDDTLDVKDIVYNGDLKKKDFGF
ncbi:periplasmic diheme c-type cytochrome, NapB [hydrothermal vent metagenome]|uniref:Periplasmic diheme c-type cytochrome, NapB n=1 Tax=hydrothermal vent metagenome TaxID=652676 RepID=A0A1W1EG67_9ZZZZ